MPVSGVEYAFDRLAVLVLCEIQARAEVSALAAQDNCVHTLRRRREKRIQLGNELVVHGISFVGPVKGNGRDVVFDIDPCNLLLRGTVCHEPCLCVTI